MPPTAYCHPDDAEATVERLVVDAEFRRALGRRAEEFVRTRWSLPSVARAYLRLFEHAAPADWLTTLELMTMYDKYFTKEQRERLPFFNDSEQCIAEWDAMVAHLHALRAAGTPPEALQVQQAARNWMTMLERDTGGGLAVQAQRQRLELDLLAA